ncbi:MAG: AAA family ATPase, partial [Chloroflexota bacterium]
MATISAHLKLLFPATKLRPPGTQDTIQRTFLIDQLRQLVLAHRLILISAPAGSGKTTLAADFARSTETEIVRWLSLDEGDNDLKAFLLGIVLALVPDIDEEWSLLVSQGTIPARQVANALINRLDENLTQPLVLVLDDLHLVTDSAIHQFLDYLIERLPVQLHLLITTRYDPPLALSKLRARGELAELRLESLRFNRTEVNELLNRVLKLNISDALVNQMVERTEGWIAGLRLLALSLEGIDALKRAQYIEDLAQNDRYVFELLAEEVLRQQQDDIRRFLLETSILDELTPERCAAVTRQPDAADKLDHLHRHNLFLVSVGDGSYRYHALFRDFLRQQLKRQPSDDRKELHRRAARVQTDPIQKLEHLVAAEQWDEVIDTFRQALMAGVESIWANTGGLRWQTFIERVPQELQQTDPWLMTARASMAFDRGVYSTSMPLLETAYHRFHEQGDAEGEFLTKVYLFIPQVEQATSADVFQQFYDHVSNFVPVMTPRLHTSLLQAGLWNSVTSYQDEQVESYLLKLTDALVQEHDQGVFPTFAQAVGHALFFTHQGAVPFERILPFMKRYAGGEQSIIRMGICNIEAFLGLFRGDLDRAWSAAQNSREIARYYDGFAWAENVVDSVLLSVLLIREDYTEFDH